MSSASSFKRALAVREEAIRRHRLRDHPKLVGPLRNLKTRIRKRIRKKRIRSRIRRKKKQLLRIQPMLKLVLLRESCENERLRKMIIAMEVFSSELVQ